MAIIEINRFIDLDIDVVDGGVQIYARNDEGHIIVDMTPEKTLEVVNTLLGCLVKVANTQAEKPNGS